MPKSLLATEKAGVPFLPSVREACSPLTRGRALPAATPSSGVSILLLPCAIPQLSWLLSSLPSQSPCPRWSTLGSKPTLRYCLIDDIFLPELKPSIPTVCRQRPGTQGHPTVTIFLNIPPPPSVLTLKLFFSLEKVKTFQEHII